ncbi:hypothetical protein KR222_007952, partial [Zaprionus bogoriensis]
KNAGIMQVLSIPNRYIHICLKSTEICSQRPAVVGFCFARLHRWTYAQLINACFEYYYGGCDGNDNRFWTKEECEAKCK